MVKPTLTDLLRSEDLEVRRVAQTPTQPTSSLEDAEDIWQDALQATLDTPEAAGRPDEATRLALIAVDEIEKSKAKKVPVRVRSQAWTQAIGTITICGNPARSGDLRPNAENAILKTARALAAFRLTLVHGPRGAGIQVANHCHNSWQAKHIRSRLVFNDRSKLMTNTDLVL